ncbi:mechanosensitive ion channel protein 6-like isoform X2 [Papaver somniferum]|nr:mechanosensitive ion channel protein 6-like isoform X2 [Papaver somniferum]
MDPPADIMKSGRVTAKSVQLRSGFIAGGRKSSANDEDSDEDSFAEKYEDIPDEYKKSSKSFTTLVIFQWVVLILILSAFVCSLTIQPLRKMTPWALHLWKWELILLVLICGRLLSGWGIRIVVFFVERNFILRKRVLYFVYGLRKAVQNCLWLGMVLIAWSYLLDKKVAKEVIKDRTRIPFYVTKCLILLLVGTLLWLVKTLIVKVLASSFHVTTYFDRIQDSLFTQYVIETLSGPPVIEIHRNQEEEEQVKVEVENLQMAGCTMPADLRETALRTTPIIMKKSGRIIQNTSPNVKSGKPASGQNTTSKKLEEGITIDELHKLNQKNISAWKMKRLMNIIRHGVITTVDEHIDGDSCNEGESATTIRSESEAKSAATKIFNNVAKPYSKFIHLENIMRFMKDEEAEKTMSQFEGAIETDKIS